MKPVFVRERASAFRMRERTSAFRTWERTSAFLVSFARAAAVTLAFLGGLAAVGLALPAGAQIAPPAVSTQDQTTPEAPFNGPQLYQAAFEQIRDRHLDLRDPAVRAAWVADWQNKYDGTKELDTEAGTDEAIKAMVASLHLPFDMYLGRDFASASAFLEANPASIGALLHDRKVASIDPVTGVPKRQRVTYIAAIRKDSPAEGILLPGDDLEEVGCATADPADASGCQKVVELSPREIERALYGKPDSAANLTVRRYDEKGNTSTLRVEIKRQVIHTRVVFVERTQAGVPVIRIINFLPDDFEKQFADALKEVGAVPNLVIDVRDNPGGRTDAAINALAMIVRTGKLNVTLTREADALIRDEVTAADGWFTIKHVQKGFGRSFPVVRPDLLVDDATRIVVLVNHRSMSAAEIFAGALKVNQRAIIVGETTYGKGVGQVVIMGLPFGRRLHITAFEFLPGGVAHNHIGIEPDVKVTGEDAQLIEAQRQFTPAAWPTVPHQAGLLQSATLTGMDPDAAATRQPPASSPKMPEPAPEKCVGNPYTQSQLPQTLCGMSAANVFKDVIKPSLAIVRISPKYAGSGFAVTNGGGACLIVTANHVVGVRQFATLTLPTATGYTRVRAEVIQRDPGLDLAALEIPESANYKCKGINLAEQIPAAGEHVLAAGFPLEMQEPIITPGNVVGANQKLDPKDLLNGENASNLFVVTEQLIYPGNSGGLLTKSSGEVYGLINHSNVKDRSWSVESIHIRQFLRTLAGWENF
ncbi:MAG: trypsin-like peptidase domain-containing protein [Candidatus Melainabacteria bacterium]|nr:trypsin-like peptidase domain-containing protein [Candidatus Melainabacteria bacterium]